jgi:hypothetical protein
MRGELNIRNEYRNALNRAGLDVTAPSTPGTASSMRTNPPSYQRMHSNDSNKDGTTNGRISDWLEHPSTVHAPGSAAAAKKYLNVSNRFRRASNPALNRHHNQLTPRQSGMSPLSYHYRHPPASRSRHLIGNSALPPLPPSINARSHSLDGLLDSSTGKAQWTPPGTATAEGLNKEIEEECTKESVRNTTNRRSKSLDDLLDDDHLLIVEDERETQSMEDILASTESIRECCASPDLSEKMCENEVMTVDNTISMDDQDDSGIQCDTPKRTSDTGSFDDDTISNSISIASSTTSDKKAAGKTFLNKLGKKVKNLIKK